MESVVKFCRRLLVACAASVPCFAAAQTVLGSACATFPGVYVQQQTVTLNHSAAAGQLIVVGVAVNAPAQLADANPVSDSAGNGYPISNAVTLYGNSGVLFAFAGRAAAALNAGGSITIGYFSTGSTTAQSCVEAVAFPGVSVANPDDAYGAGYGTGNSLMVTASTSTQHSNELVYSVFASAGTPGAVAALAPAQGVGGTCSGDGTLCLLPAWNLGAASAGIYEGADASSANSVGWGALLITFQSNDRIFANGFE